MLVREVRRLALVLGLVIVLFYASFHFLDISDSVSLPKSWWFGHAEYHSGEDVIDAASPSPLGEASEPDDASTPPPPPPPPLQQSGSQNSLPEYQELFASSTPDGRFFPIDFGGHAQGLNPNIIPHPTKDDTWIVVAQKVRDDTREDFVEMACNAVFQQGVLRCVHPATPLPIEPTTGARCTGKLEYFNLNVGPHDARVFLGPDRAYTIFGSNSQLTCFGQFVQDFGDLMSWGGARDHNYGAATEIHRPLPWNEVEKNWFLFWDADDRPLVHYDITPSRVFANINADGTSGPDLGGEARAIDEVCMKRFLPQIAKQDESLHQATNSLSVTMCRRSEPDCTPTDDNTFILAIYQHKKFHQLHAIYEPYVMLFRRRTPFQLVAMSRRPLLIHGRGTHTRANGQVSSDMFYITSVSWKSRANRYHGYLDDEMFLAFGIEDERAAGTDVRASDVLQDIGMCLEAF